MAAVVNWALICGCRCGIGLQTAAEEGGPRSGGELEAGSDCGSEAAVVGVM